jgi:hypothetical protein
MNKYFSDKEVWMEFPFGRLQGLAGGELLFYFDNETGCDAVVPSHRGRSRDP